MAERFFWPAETRKNLNFLSCIYDIHLLLKNCSDINEGIVIQLLVYYVVLLKGSNATLLPILLRLPVKVAQEH